MAIVKTLDIILRATTGKLEQDFAKARKMFSKAFSSVGGQIFTAVAGAVSFASAMNSVITQFGRVDEISDTAKTLGLTFAEMERLTVASEMSGVQIEMFAKIAGDASIKAYEAASGNKALSDTFKKLGIDAKRFVGLSLEDKIGTLAAAFAKMDADPVQRMVIASELFGKNWRKVLPLLDESAGFLEKAAKWSAAYELGVTAAEIDLIENANVAFKELQMATVGIARKIAIQFAPAVELLMRQLAAAIRPGTLLNNVLRALGDIILAVTFVATGLLVIVNGINELFGGWLGKTLRLVLVMGGLVIVLRSLAAIMRTVYMISKLQLAVDAARAALAGVTAKQIVLATAFLMSTVWAVQRLEAEMSKTFGTMNELKDGLGEMKDFDLNMNVTTTVNQQSATMGSQAAFEQLYKVKLDGPAQDMVNEQKKTNEILEQLKDNAVRDRVEEFMEGTVL